LPLSAKRRCELKSERSLLANSNGLSRSVGERQPTMAAEAEAPISWRVSRPAGAAVEACQGCSRSDKSVRTVASAGGVEASSAVALAS
jgi:hypothetical protein